jgi:hypothetical protein
MGKRHCGSIALARRASAATAPSRSGTVEPRRVLDLISHHDRISVVRIGCKGVVALAAVVITTAMGSGCGAYSQAGGAAQEPATLFLAGDGEMWVVDVADEDARQLAIRRLAPGDPPHRIAVRGDRLVFWGYDTLTTPVADPSRELETLAKDSWIWIPSDDPEAVWVGFLDNKRPNRARRLAELREIDADGTVLTRGVEPPDGSWPHVAMTAGLIFESPGRGVYLMDPDTGSVIRSFPHREIGDKGPAQGSVLASSTHDGRQMILTDFATGEQRPLAAPNGFAFEGWSAEFAPDGELLGVPMYPADRGDGAPRRLALVSLADGEVSIVPGSEVAAGYVMVAWSASGAQVFMTGGERFNERVITAYDLGTESARRLDIDIGDFYDFAAR